MKTCYHKTAAPHNLPSYGVIPVTTPSFAVTVFLYRPPVTSAYPQRLALPKLTPSGRHLTPPPHAPVVLRFRRPGKTVAAQSKRVKERITIRRINLAPSSGG